MSVPRLDCAITFEWKVSEEWPPPPDWGWNIPCNSRCRRDESRPRMGIQLESRKGNCCVEESGLGLRRWLFIAPLSILIGDWIIVDSDDECHFGVFTPSGFFPWAAGGGGAISGRGSAAGRAFPINFVRFQNGLESVVVFKCCSVYYRSKQTCTPCLRDWGAI